MSSAPVDAAREPWEPLAPPRAAELLRDIGIPWYVAGGWALDLFLEHETRGHGDLDVSILRGDESALHRQLAGWELFIADVGTLTPWRAGEPFPRDRHAIWARERGRSAWQLEFAVERSEEGRWIYRRHEHIGARTADIGRRSSEGIPYLRPDIVLLYKSKDPRPVDESDLLAVLPNLDVGLRSTLAAWLWTTAPGHRWLERLK